MTVTARIPSETARRGGWPTALFLGAFAVACTEFVPVGLLPQIVNDLHITPGTAGQLVTANALALAVGAPILAAVFAGADRRRVLMVTLTVFAAGHVMAGLAPSYPVLLASRLISGATMGLYLATAIATAARLAPEPRRARTIATIVAGVSTATALGVPVSTLLGQGLSWRLALGGLAVPALVALALNHRLLPSLGGDESHSQRERFAALRGRPVLLGLGAIVVFWGASFTVFTYLAPLLHARAGLGGAAVTGVLFLAGLGAVAGNLLGGRLADARPRAALAGTAAVTAAALLLILPATSSPLGAVVLVAIWQLAAWSFVPVIQSVLFRAAGPGGELALSFAVSGFNIGIVIGAGLGGVAIDRAGLSAVAALGGGLSVMALALVVSLIRARPGPGTRIRAGRPCPHRLAGASGPPATTVGPVRNPDPWE
ncbi:MFS transporter [Nocardia mexicana]|uniref:DHA1 family inner membrane transport protein n=1 Tax=Nocardia mexicana TaxID=279262 RepID=A0A370H0Z2_9NOCA|nr:MFS transporter [Nocardia mexicana]RDI49412.1 DHA1 family inner membrane transport protein [Nocardia mexicana]